MKQAYLSELAGLPLKTFLKLQGYNVNLVNKFGKLYEFTDQDLLATIPDRSEEISEAADPDLASADAECSDEPAEPVYDAEAEGTYVDPRIATHADIYMCQLGLWDEAGLYFGDPEKLTPKYPGDILYNAVCTRDYFVHLIPGTDEDMASAVMAWRRQLMVNEMKNEDHKHRHNGSESLQALGVTQGYTRCNCLPVDNRSFITSDEGLAKVLENQGASCLLIRPGYIELPGFDYGFIGGCAGHIYVHNSTEGFPDKQRTIVFNGNLYDHPDAELMIEYIQSRNIYPIFFNNYPLEDIGSILATE